MLPPLRYLPPQHSVRIRAALNFLTARSGLLVCALFLLLGLALAGDYGIDPDEKNQRRIAQANWNYLRGQADSVAQGLPLYSDRVYGVAFELPLLLAQQALGLTKDRDIHRLRALLTHLFFIVGGYFCYRLAYRLFNNRLLAILALLIFLLHPRLYAHSFFNSKDPVFLSMLMIALYLLERAFRRDTLGAFLLLGAAVGLLTNLRIMGIMLFAAPLAMRGLDWFYARKGPERKRILLTAGLFAVAAGLTLYAATPYAWTNPVGYLAESLALTIDHPAVALQLFQGNLLFSKELPPHYTAVWFAITTPPPLLLLGLVGAAATIAAVLRRPGAVLRNTRLRFPVLLLACFLLPPAAAALLGSNQHQDWRHFYFLAAPFGLLAAGGLHCLISARAGQSVRAGVYGLAGIGLALLAIQMAQIHPLQDVYFNFLVDRTTPEQLRTQYRMTSPNARKTPLEPALEYLRERHPGATLAVRGVRRSQLPAALQAGFQDDKDFAAADYALFRVQDDGHQDLAFNGLPVGRIYDNTYLAVKPLRADRMTAAALETYQEIYRQAVAGEPIIRAAYDVYLQGRTLTFVRENCPPDDRTRRVLVKIFRPNPEGRTGFATFLRSHGVRWDDTCLAVIQLPAYAEGDLIIGQDQAAGEYRWEELYSLSRPGLRERIAAARRQSRQPSRPGDFAVFLEQGAGGRQRLLYAKTDCSEVEYQTLVVLHIYPTPGADLPPYVNIQDAGYAIQDFYMPHYGGRPGGDCVAIVTLPEYPIAAIHTGQEGRWEVALYPPDDPEPLRDAYAALSEIPPVARAAFDLYIQGNQLLYLRETCAAADLAAGFFLHILPQDIADLPPERQAAGFANLDFAFDRWGGLFDGKCLAAVPLPDYPVKEIRTGQHTPGQGELWAAEFAVGR